MNINGPPEYWVKEILSQHLQFFYSIFGLILSAIFILGGILLFYLRITGSVNFLLKIPGLDSQVFNAAPGVVLFIIGLLIAYITRFKTNIK